MDLQSVWMLKPHKIVAFLFSNDFWWFIFPPIPFMWHTKVFTQVPASGCTDIIYHVNLDILWVLAWDSQTQGGK